ncbi:DUF1653 domain-containing protein [Mesorhizobium sp. M2A.F.Ca.ET.039.01.1.1]|uniref:DUF1653 domain-containing protein n=1 Tax=Mesorhizobium sp. M2A.F.Ca.ET.039.01.1.1 TaxID=2496746 RepID=UPI000FCC5742|nr:DUF1653 domain-containing protein [Mesorhizobium sp. M2A.F.Ca.ET.039.01.1.1]RWX72522.1 DUF1653 domain-containing protein [Mesorhizobium sp. M2A.F.Ca.ET.039.01.1.1]
MTEDELFKSRAATACRRSCERRGMTPCVDSEDWKPCQGCEREAVFIELNSGVPREEHERRVAELLEANNRYQEEAREARRRDQINTSSMSTALAAAASKMLVVGEELTKRKNRISELEMEVLEHQQLFDLRWKAHMRAIERWRNGNPGNELVQPDLANLDVWLLDQLDQAQDKIDGLSADLDSALEVLIRRINGEADLASAAEWVRLNYPNLAGKIGNTVAEIVVPSSGDVFADLGVERPADLPPAWRPTHRHYKGGYYRVLMTGRFEENLSEAIVYDNEAGEVWIRRTENFNTPGRFTPLGPDFIWPIDAPQPDDPGPHHYSPSVMHMGDCSICGDTADNPNHIKAVPIGFSPPLPLADDGDHSDA